jgi:hypothetical protein
MGMLQPTLDTLRRMKMSEKEIREKLLAILFDQNKTGPSTLVERLLDLVEEVAAFDRDTAYESGYTKGYEEGGIDMQYKALDEGLFLECDE